MQMPMLAVRVRLAAAEGWARADADVRDAAALGWARQMGGGRRRRKRRRSETVMQLGGCSAVGEVDARGGPKQRRYRVRGDEGPASVGECGDGGVARKTGYRVQAVEVEGRR
jgi:hypothetical protein